MPFALIADTPGHATLQEYELPPLEPDQIRIRSAFSSTKHGTEMRIFRGDSADTIDRWNTELRLHVKGEDTLQSQFPMKLGERFVGQVIEVGSRSEVFKTGDRVVGGGQIKEIHTVSPEYIRVVPETIPAENLLYDEAAMYALGGIRDAPVRLGDRIAIFGLGAIGQMAVQLARLAGARLVVASDPIERRRKAAACHGADVVFDPTVLDVSVEIKGLTAQLGVDVSLETSGSYHALCDALRATRYQGVIVSSAYYTGEAQGLVLSGEWHRNQLTLISSRGAGPPVPRDYSWDTRLMPEVVALLDEGRLGAVGLIDPVVPMSRAAEIYMACNEHPEYSIKLGIDHSLKDPL